MSDHDEDEAAAAAEPYEIVSADDRLSDDRLSAGAAHGWILVEQDDEPIAFLSSEAASETRGRTPLDYLREMGADFAGELFSADLTDTEQLFRDRRGFGDPQRAVVIFDPARFAEFDLTAPLNAQPLARYCPTGANPKPSQPHCVGCICGRRRD